MKIYLAGASAELLICEHWMKKLQLLKHTITHDWITNIQQEMSKGNRDQDLSLEEQKYYANLDLDGVRSAELVWILTPQNTSAGAWIEFGYAISLFKTIILSGPKYNKSVFSALANQRFESHDLAFHWIKDFYS